MAKWLSAPVFRVFHASLDTTMGHDGTGAGGLHAHRGCPRAGAWAVRRDHSPEGSGGEQICVAVSGYEKNRRYPAPSFTGKIAVESCLNRRSASETGTEAGGAAQPTTVYAFLVRPYLCKQGWAVSALDGSAKCFTICSSPPSLPV